MKIKNIYNLKTATFSMLALTAILAGCDNKSAGGMPERPPAQVQVAKPIVKSVEYWDNYSARLDAIEYVELRSRLGGYLTEINFKEGQLVKEGDLLFVIDPRPYEAALLATKAHIKEIEARLSLAESNVARAKGLYEVAAVSKEVLDTRNSELLSAQAAMAVAQANLVNAELNLEYTHIKAPISGKISDIKVDVGNLINANSTLLTSIVKSDIIQASFEVSERDNLRYKRNGLYKTIDIQNKKGPEVKVTLLDGGDSLNGMLTYFDNKMGDETSSLTLRADIDNKDEFLSAGMFATISVLGEVNEKAMLLPESSIGTDLVNRYVMVVNKDDVVEYKQLQIGRLLGKYRVVESGITADDNVVIVGLQNAMPGAKVIPTLTTLEDK